MRQNPLLCRGFLSGLLDKADAAGGGFEALGGVEFGKRDEGFFGFIGFFLTAIGNGQLR